MMDLREAIDARHAIRAYTDEPVDPDALDTLQADIEAWNAESGLHMQMAVGLDDAFLGLKTHYGRFKGVHNAIALIGSAASVEREMRVERLRARRRAAEQDAAGPAGTTGDTSGDATGDTSGDATTVEEPNRASTLQALKATDASGEAVSPVDAALQEKVGYYGERLVLRAVQLGLATSWAVLDDADTAADPWWELEDGESVVWVIAFGHGARPGGRRRSKPMAELASVEGPCAVSDESAEVGNAQATASDATGHEGEGNSGGDGGNNGGDASEAEGAATTAATTANWPDWFVRGMEAAMAAPTSLSQQPFHFTLNEDGSVTAEALRGLFSHVGLGCAKCHFEIGAAPHAVTWRAA
ncbi:nitroreductase family protein [Bifidobacterium aesculapii]|uniref:nitroreductase family protein n=1 Tax=Bifidobacterium aesculapii TaxID=1329411 RepID=UPI0006E2C030|nr:nitroreductase family protein [Bifidobacterium aesculapii]